MLGSVPYGIETNGHKMVAERLPGSRAVAAGCGVCCVFFSFVGNSVLLPPANELLKVSSNYRLSEAEPYSFGCYSRLIGEAG